METTILGLEFRNMGLYRDNGNENGSYDLRFDM